MSIQATASNRYNPLSTAFRRVLTIAYLLTAQNHFTTKALVRNSLGKMSAIRPRLPRKAHQSQVVSYSALLSSNTVDALAIKEEVAALLPRKKVEKERVASLLTKKLKEVKSSDENVQIENVEAVVAAFEEEAPASLPTKRVKKEGKKSKKEIFVESVEVIAVVKEEVPASWLAGKFKEDVAHISLVSVLIELGELTPMVVVQRPSQSIKTPYVADLIMKPAEYDRIDFITCTEQSSSGTNLDGKSDVIIKKTKKSSLKGKADAKAALSNALRQTASSPDDIHLGHTPALDCAGMIVPGAVVYCTPNDGHTKTKFTVQLCEEQREDGGVVTVACHPNLAERAARVLLEDHLLTDELGNYDSERVLRQQTFGNSRVDFVVQNESENSITLVEVKNVVGADYKEGSVPSGRCEVGVYSVTPKEADGSDYKRHAIFPHGSKKAEVNVVSDRAIKHIHELTCMQGTTDDQGRYVKSSILFIINRSDCEAFRPCHEADMLFAQMLLRAQERGVLIIAKEVIWTLGTAVSGRSLPVAFDKSVTSNIDENHLSQVLLFNESGSGRSPSPSKKKMKEEDEDEELGDEKEEKEVTAKVPQKKRIKKMD